MPEAIPTAKPSTLKPLLFILLVVVMIIGVRLWHLDQYLEKERLRQFVAGYGVWGPIVYLVIWTLAPPCCSPVCPSPWPEACSSVLFGGWSM